MMRLARCPARRLGPRRDLAEWVELGMPSAETMTVRAYPAGTGMTVAASETIVRRRATDFVWRVV